MTTVPSFVSQQLNLLSSGAEPSDVRDGKSFISPGSQAIQTGTMVDNGDLGTITPGIEPIVIPEGYTSGGTVAGEENLTPDNIKTGVTIFDVEGTAILAEGNATSADVRAGVTFSSSSGAGIGALPDNGSLGTIVPGTSDQPIPAGYTSGGTVSGDPELVASNIKSGVEIFGVTGNVVQSTGTATADKLLAGQTASNASGPITGTMPNNGSLGTITPTTTNQAIPAGYTSGGTVAGSGNLVAGNIRLGVNLFGVTGSLDPGTQTGGTAEPDQVLAGETFTNDLGVQTGTMPNNGSVTITPSGSSQTIPEGYHDGTGTVSAVIFDAAKVLEGTTIAGTAGTMNDNGALGTITPGTTNQTISAGYTSGGTVIGDVNLIPENIKNGVGIFGVTGSLSGGMPNTGDWSAYETLHNWSGTTTSIPASSWGTFVDITGEGVALFLSSDRQANIRVTIDGGTPIIFTGATLNTLSATTNTINQPIFFNSSIKVEVYNMITSTIPYFLDYTILKKIGEPDPLEQTILTQSQRLLANSSINSTTSQDVVNISGSGYLLGVLFTGYSSAAMDSNSIGSITIDGTPKMTNRSLINFYNNGGTKLHVFNGPIRFETSLTVSHKMSVNSAGASWTRVWYTID